MSEFTEKLKARRSYRKFDPETFDIGILIEAIEAAKHAPSGANKQPWSFCIVKNPDIKTTIRKEAEAVEKAFFENIPSVWKEDLEVLKVDYHKPFLEIAPYLIVIFKHKFQYDASGEKTPVYFADTSIGIATGMLISALTDLGIDTLTYTPHPNDFLKDILKRPDNEVPYMILVCGRGAKDYKLPDISKRDNSELIKIY